MPHSYLERSILEADLFLSEPEQQAMYLSDKSKDESRDITHEGDRIQVMVEIKKSKKLSLATSEDVGKLQVKGLEIDPDFKPVPIQPTQEEVAMVSADEDVVCVCGKVKKSDMAELEKQPNVLKIWKDTKVDFFSSKPGSFVQVATQPTGTCPIPPCDCSPGVAQGTIADVAKYLGADSIWAEGIKGDGIVVGVVDGGITAEGRPISSSDKNDPGWTNKLVKNVIDGHVPDWGTTGVAWGWHGNMSATDVLGMAPEAKLYDIRITGSALSNALAGFQWAIDRHKTDSTPQILTNSWGYFQESWDPDYTTNPNHPFTRKVIEALDEGIIVLFAAGNCGGVPCSDGRCGSDTGSGKSIWGANGHERVMTVAAANKNEQYIGYSSVGPAALHQKKPDFTSISHFEGYFASDSGTSAATPIAAGVAALLKQAKPSATQDEIKDALMDTAKDIGPSGWDKYTGAGIIKAKKAFDKLTGGAAKKQPAKCFIATAAYGSELAPPVQFLRDFRDDVILQSMLGPCFERVLDVYYRFSPPIAQRMKKNPVLKNIIKYGIVYPFIGMAYAVSFATRQLSKRK